MDVNKENPTIGGLVNHIPNVMFKEGNRDFQKYILSSLCILL